MVCRLGFKQIDWEHVVNEHTFVQRLLLVYMQCVGLDNEQWEKDVWDSRTSESHVDFRLPLLHDALFSASESALERAVYLMFDEDVNRVSIRVTEPEQAALAAQNYADVEKLCCILFAVLVLGGNGPINSCFRVRFGFAAKAIAHPLVCL